jgi:uncharacterized protein YdhG (YjbR/CyaY superfamily)
MATKGEQDVDAYIAAAPRDVQPVLRQVREAIKSAAPKAEEKISYRMAFYEYHGRLIYFAAHRTHVGMYPVIGREKELFAKELKPYLVEKATLQFPYDKPLPVGLIKKVVKERAKQNEAKAAASPRARRGTASKATSRRGRS